MQCISVHSLVALDVVLKHLEDVYAYKSFFETRETKTTKDIWKDGILETETKTAAKSFFNDEDDEITRFILSQEKARDHASMLGLALSQVACLKKNLPKELERRIFHALKHIDHALATPRAFSQETERVCLDDDDIALDDNNPCNDKALGKVLQHFNNNNGISSLVYAHVRLAMVLLHHLGQKGLHVPLMEQQALFDASFNHMSAADLISRQTHLRIVGTSRHATFGCNVFVSQWIASTADYFAAMATLGMPNSNMPQKDATPKVNISASLSAIQSMMKKLPRHWKAVLLQYIATKTK